MLVNFSDPALLGIPMILPVTWEENIAANMTRIPLFEFFPGLMVVDLYKAYRAGLQAERYAPYNGQDPGDLIVGYIADSTGKRADVVKDFLDAMIKTVNQGKAPADIITGQAATGAGEKAGDVFQTIETKTGAALKSVSGPLVPAAIIVGSLVGLYLLSFVPKKR